MDDNVDSEVPEVAVSGQRLTHHYRQFLQRLRGGGWTPATDLNAGSRVQSNALRYGWVERHHETGIHFYRITPKGAAEMRKHLPLTWS